MASTKSKRKPWDWLEDVPHDVSNLPENPGPAKKSDLLQRVADKQQIKQNNILTEMRAQAVAAARSLESDVQAAGEIMQQTLSVCRGAMDKKLLVCETTEQEDSPLRDVQGIAMSLEKSFEMQRRAIEEFAGKMERNERARVEALRPIMQKCSEKLHRCASLVPGDMQHVMAEETQALNETLMANREHILQSKTDSLIDLLTEERRATVKVVAANKVWKELHLSRCIKAFQDFMVSKDICEPPELGKRIESLQTSQEAMARHRRKLVDDIRELEPPECTKARVEDWFVLVGEHFAQLDAIHQKFFEDVKVIQEAVSNRCADEMERMREDIVHKGFCTPERGFEIMNTEFLPLIEELLGDHETRLAQYKRIISECMQRQRQVVDEINDYALGASGVFDLSQERFEGTHVAYKGDVAKMRGNIVTFNQGCEDRLQNAMSTLRQSQTESDLDANIELLRKDLAKQFAEQDVFCKQCRDAIKTYPARLTTTINQYEADLCAYFSVLRDADTSADGPPVAAMAGGQSPSQLAKAQKARSTSRAGVTRKGATSRADTSMGGAKDRRDSFTRGALRRAGSSSSFSASFSASFDVGSISKPGKKGGIQEQILFTFTVTHKYGETTFAKIKAPGSDYSAFVTQKNFNEDDGEFLHPVVVKLALNVSMKDVRQRICEGYLRHLLESRRDKAAFGAAEVKRKTQTLEQEVNATKNLMEPRCSLIEKEVGNLRRSELFQHRDMISTHVKFASALTKSVDTLVQEAKERLANEAAVVLSRLRKFSEDLDECPTVERLDALTDKARSLYAEHQTKIVSRAAEEKAGVYDTLNTVTSRGETIRDTFISFTSGGSFSAAEIAEFSDSLASMETECTKAQDYTDSAFKSIISPFMRPLEKLMDSFSAKSKNYRKDLDFCEGLERMLKTPQILILSEVAKSNGQAENIAHAIQRIAALQTPEEYCELLSKVQYISPLMQARASYLACIRSKSSKIKKTAAQAGLPNFMASLDTHKESLSAITSTGSILDRQEPSRQKDAFVGTLTDKSSRAKKGNLSRRRVMRKPEISRLPHQPSVILEEESPEEESTQKSSDQGQTLGASRTAKSAPSEETLKPLQEEGTIADAEPTPSKSASSIDRKKTSVGETSRQHSMERTESLDSTADSLDEEDMLGDDEGVTRHSIGSNPSQYLQHISLEYKKCPSFGEGEEELGKNAPEPQAFLPIIRHELRGTRRKILIHAMKYFERRGRRDICPLVKIPRLTADFMKQQDGVLQGYRKQAETYHKNCLEEFGTQLKMVIDATVGLLPVALKYWGHDETMGLLSSTEEAVRAYFKSCALAMNGQKEANRKRLSPDLCDPSKRHLLEEVINDEEQREVEATKFVTEYPGYVRDKLLPVCTTYFEMVRTSYEEGMKILGDLLTLDNVDVGESTAGKVKDISRMLMQTEKPWMRLDEDDGKDAAASARTHAALPQNWPEEIMDEQFKSLFPECVKAKTSKGRSRSKRSALGNHVASNEAQQKLSELYSCLVKAFTSEVLAIQCRAEEERDEALGQIRRWATHWKTSVASLQQFSNDQ